MEHGYINIDAYIRRAREERSDVIAAMLSRGWTRFTQALARLVHHVPHGHLSHS